MKDKGVIAFTAVASLGVLALMAAPALPGSQAAKDAASLQACSRTSPCLCRVQAWTCQEGALTMKFNVPHAPINFNLQAKCASHLSDSLKDPNSMRIIDGSYGARGDRKIVVNLTYTATNSFGGRVTEQNSCTYTL